MPTPFSFEFESSPQSFRQIMAIRDPVFCIPEHQRNYAWDTRTIERLMSNCLHGFSKLSQSPKDAAINTFLGTTILLERRHGLFRIIDGKQRLISLLLISCSLLEELSRKTEHLEALDVVDIEASEWLREKIFELKRTLVSCIKGYSPAYQASERDRFWPRIIKEAVDDPRASSESRLNISSIARFLDEFSFEFPGIPESLSADMDEGKTIDDFEIIARNYRCIQDIVSELSNPQAYDRLDCQMLADDYLSAPEAFCLMTGKTRMTGGDRGSKEMAIMTRLGGSTENAALLRLILFGYYLLFHVGLNCVVTQKENAAYDMFDTLNTEGEPLTAIETLKPLVVAHENSPDSASGGYRGSAAEEHFRYITTYLIHPDTKKRQQEAADLTVSLALYLNGERCSEQLQDQRDYLRDLYLETQKACKGMEPETIEKRGLLAPEGVVATISAFARCREIYWDQGNRNDIPEDARLAMWFIRATNTSLTMPIISRYWIDDGADEGRITEVVRMLAAFLSLRRGYTGTPGDIDMDFRNLMRRPLAERDHPLSLVSPQGFAEKLNYNRIWSPQDLKERLSGMLEAVIGETGTEACREKWVSRVSETPVHGASRPVTRFLLLAAMHGTRPAGAGMLTREGVRAGDENDHWNLTRWADDSLTVEPVAPQSRPKRSDWDKGLFLSNGELRNLPGNTLGNLILLPEDENRTAASYSWKKKKRLYQALATSNSRKRKKSAGRGALSWLEFVDDVPEWDKAFIEDRSRNLAGLAWDTIIEWLKPSEDDS